MATDLKRVGTWPTWRLHHSGAVQVRDQVPDGGPAWRTIGGIRGIGGRWVALDAVGQVIARTSTQSAGVEVLLAHVYGPKPGSAS